MTNMMKKKLLAMALSVPMLCSLAFTDFKAFAAEDATMPATDIATAETTSVDNEHTGTTTETTAVTTTGSEETTENTEPTTTWDRISNFPDENGELRFWMDDLEKDRLCTLTLTYATEDTNKPISGAQVYIYKIASLSVQNGDAKYTLIDELKEAYPELDFAGMSSEELDKIAEEIASKDLKETAQLTTDANGKCKFENLEPGLYVIKEKAKIGMAKDYEYFKSFIINAPFPDVDENLYNGHWIYDIESLPKTELKGKKKLLITPPTGDETNTTMLRYSAIVFGISALNTVAMIYVIVKRKKRNAELVENDTNTKED